MAFMIDELNTIQQAQKGDSNAFKQLVDMHKNHVAATIRGMLGNVPEVDDVGQEVFIRFYKNINQFKGNSSLKTYLTRIAINLSLNQLKKGKRDRTFAQPIKDDRIGGMATDEYEKNETRQLVQTALNRMDAKFKTVLVLRMLQGYSTKETAEILDIPLGTVLSRLNAAQKKLKEILVQLNPELAELS